MHQNLASTFPTTTVTQLVFVFVILTLSYLPRCENLAPTYRYHRTYSTQGKFVKEARRSLLQTDISKDDDGRNLNSCCTVKRILSATINSSTGVYSFIW
jgi:hypothetical protein